MEPLPDLLLAYVVPVVGACVAGGLIGFEREYRGRPAGIRTHILLALASTLLMLAATHQARWVSDIPLDVIGIDPMRMAQGILGGIGFLCGGVILRQGFSIHGLTTASSLWITAAVGVLYGVGFYGLAVGGTLATLLVLVGLRWIDARLPAMSIVDVAIRYRRTEATPESLFRALGEDFDLDLSAVSHKLMERGELIELAGTFRSVGPAPADKLSRRLCADDRIVEFEILPRKD